MGMSSDATLSLEASRPSERLRGAYELHVVEGRSVGMKLLVDDTTATRVYAGRSDRCELFVDDPSVSRRHLALELRQSELVLVDVGSRNATVVNGLRVKEVVLVGGERIRIGETTIEVRRTGAETTALTSGVNAFGRLRGKSREMQRLYPLLARLATSSVPVLIEGETGTGKEVLAEALHENGPRASAPFIVFDCTAVAPTLLESELFGYERGAFTGAVGARAGVFEEADTGTLLIDEIGDLALPMQAKLLRAVERGEIRRVGAAKSKKVDVRILSATRRDIEAMVQSGHFRDDLYHRLAVARVELPPLRQRAGDIGPLVDHFFRGAGRDPIELPMALVARWETERWPGNVRELANVLAHAARAAVRDEIGRDALPARMSTETPADDFRGAMKSAEREVLLETLARTRWNVSAAATRLGMPRRTIVHRMAKLGLKRPAR